MKKIEEVRKATRKEKQVSAKGNKVLQSEQMANPTTPGEENNDRNKERKATSQDRTCGDKKALKMMEK